jgi:nitronate monooxygenase
VDRFAKLPGVILDTLEAPVVLAPLAGGPSTPALAAAVSEAGGLGFVAAGYLTADALAQRIAGTRELTARPFGVNLFVPGEAAPRERYADYVAGLGERAGEPRPDDDAWAEKLDLLEAAPVPVVSFVFGCPSPQVVARVHAAGSEAWVTVTSPEEARAAADAGADVLVVQGGEAGGHRGSFADHEQLPVYGLLPLLQLVRAAVDRPLVASGGIATGAALAAVLCLGARAAQIGTAFLRTPEAGTHPTLKDALASDAPTALTRAFTGRLARGIRNRFMEEHPDAPIAYPELHHATSPLRARAREAGDAGGVNLWAGEAHALAEEVSAGEVVARLVAGAREAIAAVRL